MMREMEKIKNTQSKHLDIKNTIGEIKKKKKTLDELPVDQTLQKKKNWNLKTQQKNYKMNYRKERLLKTDTISELQDNIKQSKILRTGVSENGEEE